MDSVSKLKKYCLEVYQSKIISTECLDSLNSVINRNCKTSVFNAYKANIFLNESNMPYVGEDCIIFYKCLESVRWDC